VGDSETGFASHLVEFDSLVDTIGNERTEDKSTMSLGSSTLEMLKSQHKCYNYVSTLTHSQDIIVSEGILWGPRKADSYSEKIGNPAFLTKSRDSESVFPPKAIGSTLETLMENGVILTEKQRNKACSEKSDAIRGWSLSDFWEQTSWPRDSAGSGTTRFGLPVREDPDEIEDEDLKPNRRVNRDVFVYNDIGNDDRSSSISAPSSSSSKSKTIENNPYVSTIVDIDGFKSEIVDSEKNCILFMSARFCKTCKTINPAYTRMARINEENGKASNYSFMKAETSGASGKRLAKHVSVRAVPSFVFVREGKIIGSTYVSKLPNPKIDKAIQLLASGADWDYSLMDDPDDDDE
jgi:thiol-disulfide isomerase/thioredoxin